MGVVAVAVPSRPGAHISRRCRCAQCPRSGTCKLGLMSRTVWPSGLRRWLKAPFRKGVGSNPTAVTCPAHTCAYAAARIRAVASAQSLALWPNDATHLRGATRRQGQSRELLRLGCACSAARVGGASHARSIHFPSRCAPCSRRERRYAARTHTHARTQSTNGLPNHHMVCHTAQPITQPTRTDRGIAHHQNSRPFKAKAKADSTRRSSQAVPHPSTNRALRRLTSEVRRDPVHSTRYGRQRMGCVCLCTQVVELDLGVVTGIASGCLRGLPTYVFLLACGWLSACVRLRPRLHCRLASGDGISDSKGVSAHRTSKSP